MAVKREPNEVVIRRFYDELWNGWRFAVADEILAPDVRFRGSLGGSSVGIEAFKDYFHQARAAFPDLHAQIDDLIVTGEVVVARLTWSATHAGEIFGIPVTGRRWSYVGAAIFDLNAGKIKDAWIVGDTQELWRAIGASPGVVRESALTGVGCCRRRSRWLHRQERGPNERRSAVTSGL